MFTAALAAVVACAQTFLSETVLILKQERFVRATSKPSFTHEHVDQKDFFQKGGHESIFQTFF